MKQAVFLQPRYCGAVVYILWTWKSNTLYLLCVYIALSYSMQKACAVLYNHVQCLKYSEAVCIIQEGCTANGVKKEIG